MDKGEDVMTNNDRNDMIQHICENFNSWSNFYDSIVGDKNINIISRVNKWFVCFDGPDEGDMYLQSEDPRGDLQGLVITRCDCFDCF